MIIANYQKERKLLFITVIRTIRIQEYPYIVLIMKKKSESKNFLFHMIEMNNIYERLMEMKGKLKKKPNRLQI